MNFKSLKEKLKLSSFSFFTKFQLLIGCSILFSISGCIGPKKMDKWIGEQYGETTISNKPKADYFTITSPLLTADDKTSNSTKNTRKFLPLILYWEVDYQIHSTLNPKVPMNLFVSAFTTYANSKNLRQKLNGQKLELIVNKIPTAFAFNDDFRDVNLFLGQIHWEKIYILPDNTDLTITYKLVKDNIEVKNGVLIITDLNKIKEKTYFKKLRTATTEYLTQYDANIKSMAKSAVDKMLKEL